MGPNGAPKWAVFPDGSDGILIQRGERAEEFKLAVKEPELFLDFSREMYRHARMSAILASGLDKFESGQADYSNAAANLNHLTRELGVVNDTLVKTARSFWAFTDAAGNKERIHELEKMFDDHGEQFLDMVCDVCKLVYGGGDDRKNLSRGRTGPSVPEHPLTATPASGPSSTPKPGAPPGPDSSEKKSAPSSAVPAPSSGASPAPSAGGKKAG
jgi:hypothetical protein